MIELELIENKENREKVIERIEVLDQVKEILTLGNTEFVTVELAAQYYEVGFEAVNTVIKRHKEELETDGLNVLTGKDIKEILVKSNMNFTNYRGYFESEGNRFANRSNILIPKRALLRIGMLLRDSQVAKEVRTRLLDIVHDAEVHTDIVDKVVEEIRTEQQICEEMTQAIINGDSNKLALLQTELIGLKNKRIVELEETVENSITIKESKSIIRKAVVTMAKEKYNCIFWMAWNEFYKFVNYKMNINVNGRKGEGLNRFTDDEIRDLEVIAKCWLEESGVDLKLKLA